MGKGKRDALYAAILAGAEAAELDLLNEAGLIGPASLLGIPSDGWYPLGYFALQVRGREKRMESCVVKKKGIFFFFFFTTFLPTVHRPQTPKLRYTAITYLDAAVGILRSYLAPDFRLAQLKKTSDPGAIAGPGFPAFSESAAGFFPKFTIWPWRWSDIRLGSNITQMKPWKGELVNGKKELYPLAAQGMDAWRAAGRNYTGWPVTDAQRAAMKDIESNKALGLAEAIAARSLVAGEQWPILPGWPLDDQPPTLSPPLTEWAIDAIMVAKSAYAAVKADNSTGNPLAAAVLNGTKGC